MRNFTVYHIIPFIIAFGIIYLILPGKDSNITLKKEIYIPKKTSGLYINYSDGKEAELDLIYALVNESLVVWGSSELTGRDTMGYITHNFFPKQYNIPTLSMGHAGNQCFSILCQIAALNKYTKGRKMVFIISPGWFTSYYAKGTSTSSFLEFNNSTFLKSIIHSSVPDIYKNYISDYIYKKRDDINSMGREMKRLMYMNNKMNIDYPFYALDHGFTSLFSKEQSSTYFNNYIYKSDSVSSVMYINTDLDKIKSQAKEDFMNICTNNDVYVNDKYYNLYVKDKDKFVQQIVPREANREMDDFNMLVSLISYLEIDAAFIIQNLNPYVYKNLQDMKPIIDELQNITQKHNYPTYNMFTYSTKDYDSGELTDVMHMGNLGWIKVNEFIYNTLYKKESSTDSE
jgi:D-alanine transfer protein